MFGMYDKMTLSLINAADINGKLLPFSKTLPVVGEIEIPEELSSVDVFEYQEGFISGGEIVFSIYVGEKSTIDEMVDAKDGINMQLREEIEIPSVDTPVCYRIVDGKKKIYATLEDNDVVVKDHEELKSVIKSLSGHYEEFNRSVQKIKTFNNTSNS